MIDKEQHAKRKEEFSAYYDAELKQIMQKNEMQRKKYLRSFGILLFFSLFFYPLAAGLTFFLMVQMSSVDIGPFFVVSALFMILLYSPIHKYKNATKISVMPKFARFFGDFKYEFERTVDDFILRQSKLFSAFRYNTGDDYFCGTYKGVDIIIAEEKLQKETRMLNDGINKSTVFRGICILLEMNKNFCGQTVALSDRGILNKFYQVPKLQRVELEDPLFEKAFEVYSDNQIEARYLLTTVFMERMMKLRDIYGGKNVQFSFFENKLLIAVETKQDMFETASLFKESPNREQVEQAFEQFCTVCSVVDILKLNQRIGM